MQKAFASGLSNWKPWALAIEFIGYGKGYQLSVQRTNYALTGNHIFLPGTCGPYFSTTADTALKKKQKPKKKKTTSASVIQVSEEKISVKKARIKQLNRSQINMVNETLYGFEAADAKFQEELLDSTIQKEEDVGVISDIKDNLTPAKQKTGKTSKQNSKKSKRETETSQLHKNLAAMKDKSTQEIFNESLTAFISVCMYLGHYNDALEVFNQYLYDKSSQPFKTVTLVSYNEILKAMALQGNYKEMEIIVNEMKNCHISPDVNTFAYLFGCLGTLHDKSLVVKEVQSALEWMENEKITLDDVFSQARFPGNLCRRCLEAVQLVIPDARSQIPFFNSSIESNKEDISYHNCLLNSLNETIFSHKVSSPAEGVLTVEEILKLAEDQIEMEINGFVEVPNIYLKGKQSSQILDRASELTKIENEWRDCLRSRLKTLKALHEDEFRRTKPDYRNLYPFLCAVDEEQLLNLLVKNVNSYISENGMFSTGISALAEELGNQCYQLFYCCYLQKTNLADIYKRYCQMYLDCTKEGVSYIPRVQWEELARVSMVEELSCLSDCPPPWSRAIKYSLGKSLLNLIISSITITDQQSGICRPVFMKVMRHFKNYRKEEIDISPFFKKCFPFSLQNTERLSFPASMLPMMSPPVPRTSLVFGGYVMRNSDFVRVVLASYQQKKQLQEMDLKNLYPVFDSLNQMGAVPWKINGDMLDLVVQVFLDKGWMDMSIPIPPEEVEKCSPKVQQLVTVEDKIDWKKKMAAFRKKQNETLGLWSHMLYKLSIANYFRDKVMWLPLNLDFRGRTYTIHPHLNHYSNDITRSLLCFAQGKKLGPDGLTWLKLHLINLTGMKKKCKFEDRIRFCEAVMDDILDSADNPLDGRRWWTESDEPWQTLAACKDLAAAVRSGDPENYVSHLPIHQDGSCNGLQHYAALGRDKAGAMSVNLSPSPVPQDVYSDIVELVEKRRRMDAESGVKIAQMIEGLVQRKIIKQTVMTTVYGVTPFGARLQILRKLKDLDLKDIPLMLAAKYLAELTFGSIGTLFTSAESIQQWFINIAEGVTRNQYRNMEWVTPLGFPVVQPYIKLKIGGEPSFTRQMNDTSVSPNVIKQKNAFPPNFIHSLDSSHMMLTSLYCQHAGITFVSIHDCFWTHACTVPIMSEICREQFISLYSRPVLEDLAQSLLRTFGDHPDFSKPLRRVSGPQTSYNESLQTLLANVPKKGEFDLNSVKDSVFFFS